MKFGGACIRSATIGRMRRALLIIAALSAVAVSFAVIARSSNSKSELAEVLEAEGAYIRAHGEFTDRYELVRTGGTPKFNSEGARVTVTVYGAQRTNLIVNTRESRAKRVVVAVRGHDLRCSGTITPGECSDLRTRFQGK